MRVVDVELAFAPGHGVDEAVELLERAGLPIMPGYDAVPMRGKARTTYVFTVQDPTGQAERLVGAVNGVADVVGIFGNPVIAPFASTTR